jgi:hypothetical protein
MMIRTTSCRRVAACAVLLGTFAVSPGVFAQAPGAEVQITDKARAHFQAGVNYLQDPDGARYEEAYREFQAAYADSPSWKILGNLGISAMKLERDGEALAAFEKYLAEGGDQIDAAERAQFERDVQTLKAGVVTLTLDSVPPGAMITDERTTAQGGRIVNQYGPINQSTSIGIRAGQHRMTARLSGYQDAVWDFDARPAATESHTFAMQQAAATPATGGTATGTIGADTGSTATNRPTPTGVYIGLAATGVFALGAGITSMMAVSKHSEYDTAIDDGDRAAAEDAKDGGESLNLVADVFWGATAVSAAVTAVLYFTRPEVPVGGDTATLRVTPLVGRDAAALSITGSF